MQVKPGWPRLAEIILADAYVETEVIRALGPSLSHIDIVAADRHRVLPLLAGILGRASADTTDAVSAQLRAAKYKNVRRLLSQSDLVKHVRQKAPSAEFSIIKGWSVAEACYARNWERDCGDVDFLCQNPGDVLLIEKVLSELGCVSETSHISLGDKPRMPFFKSARPSKWLDPSGAWSIEVHWLRPDVGKFPTCLLNGQSWQREQILPGSGQLMRLPELLLYLIGHGSRSAWRRGKWLTDIVFLSAKLSPREWVCFFKLVESEGYERHLACTLAVLKQRLPDAALIEKLGNSTLKRSVTVDRICQEGFDAPRSADHGVFSSLLLNLILAPSQRLRWTLLKTFFLRASDVQKVPGSDIGLALVAIVERPLRWFQRWRK